MVLNAFPPLINFIIVEQECQEAEAKAIRRRQDAKIRKTRRTERAETAEGSNSIDAVPLPEQNLQSQNATASATIVAAIVRVLRRNENREAETANVSHVIEMLTRANAAAVDPVSQSVAPIVVPRLAHKLSRNSSVSSRCEEFERSSWR